MDERQRSTSVGEGQIAVSSQTDEAVGRPAGRRQRSRRRHAMMRLLAAGIGLSALSRLGTRTAQAANGDPLLAGQTVDATAPTRVRNGVSYTADSTADGVQGYATGANNAGLFGRNNVTDGIGVSGAAPSGTGVFGESLNGFGVGGRSDSKYGVYGKSTSGEGIYGESASAAAVRGVSTSGVGGAFGGGLAAIRLVPATSGTGAPTTGAHQVGELYADSTGVLYYCTVAGTPGTWLPVVLGSGGGSGMTNPMTAQDDLIVGGASGAPTRLAKGSNGQVLTLDGSGHVSWAAASGGGSSWMAPFTAPPTYATWAWVNQGGATGDDDSGGVYIQAPGSSSGGVRTLVRSAPSAPYTITALLASSFYGVNSCQTGLLWRESSSGKLVLCSVAAANGYVAAVVRMNSPTSWNSTITARAWVGQGLTWLRVSDNGTNRSVSISSDGRRWISLLSISRTDWITPDQVGIYADADNSSNLDVAVTLRSWSVSQP